MKKGFFKYLLPSLLVVTLVLPLNATLAKYMWSKTVGSVDLKVEASVKRIAKVRDLYWNGSGFFADPNARLGVKILRDGSIDVTGSSTTEITELSQLNGTLSHNSSDVLVSNYTVWLNAPYTFTANDAGKGINMVNNSPVSNGYAVKRYSDDANKNAKALLIADGVTIQIEGIIDGNRSRVYAYFINTSYSPSTQSTSNPNVNVSRSLLYIASDAHVTLGSTAVIQNQYQFYSSDIHYGVVFVDGGVLDIRGGAIQNNTSNISSGGSYGEGLGLSISSGTVNMYSGSISNNVFSGSASAGRGAGIGMTGGTFNLYDGSISNNSATNNSSSGGGGISTHRGGTVNIYGGEIKNNKSRTSGGGIRICTGTVTMTGGIISGNSTTSTQDYGSDYGMGHGGGVFISDSIYSGSKFIMKGGTITGNKSANMGGGVYRGSGGTLTLTNGAVTISGNTGTKGYNDTYPANRAYEATTLDLLPEEVAPVEYLALDPWSINENIEWWPVENELVYETYGYEGLNAQFPYAGFDYTMGFGLYEPDLYALPEAVTVTITNTDEAGTSADTVYTVCTDGRANGEGVPVFDPESGTLTIPASLLTEQTASVAISAAAVPVTPEPACSCKTHCAEGAVSAECPVCSASADGCKGCLCETRCAGDAANTACPTCAGDISACGGKATETTPVCSCKIRCTEGAASAECPVCSASADGCKGCLCETRCTGDAANTACPTCAGDISACGGKAMETIPSCTCEARCAELNSACAVCNTDISACIGKVPEPVAASLDAVLPPETIQQGESEPERDPE